MSGAMKNDIIEPGTHAVERCAVLGRSYAGTASSNPVKGSDGGARSAAALSEDSLR